MMGCRISSQPARALLPILLPQRTQQGRRHNAYRIGFHVATTGWAFQMASYRFVGGSAPCVGERARALSHPVRQGRRSALCQSMPELPT